MAKKHERRKSNLKCPRCGSKLVLKKFVEVWSSSDKPEIINEYPVCEQCQVGWMQFDVIAMEPYEEEQK